MQGGNLILIVVMMAVFYFMLIRPQKKRMAEHNKLLSTLGPGDEVVTIGGLYGFVNRVEDDMVFLEVSDGIEIRFSKSAISRKLVSEDAPTEVASEKPEPAEPLDADPPAAN